MKRLIISIIVCIIGLNLGAQSQSPPTVYTGLVNIIHEPFHFPMIGFVNIALGSHKYPQVGFVNYNQRDFGGLQLSFVNYTGGRYQGLQFGFVSLTADEFSGLQWGHVNIASKSLEGMQIGFVNMAAEDLEGAQLGFVNVAKNINGSQLGFVNIAEEFKSGIPIGFFSYVREGGFKAVEMGVSEIAHLNFVFKTGVKQFYTSFLLINYNHNSKGKDKEHLWGGMGIGTIFDIDPKIYFNPELILSTTYNTTKFDQIINNSIVPAFGYRFTDNISLILAPAATWSQNNSDTGLVDPVFKIYEYQRVPDKRFIFGGRVGLRFEW